MRTLCHLPVISYTENKYIFLYLISIFQPKGKQSRDLKSNKLVLYKIYWEHLMDCVSYSSDHLRKYYFELLVSCNKVYTSDWATKAKNGTQKQVLMIHQCFYNVLYLSFLKEWCVRDTTTWNIIISRMYFYLWALGT